MTDQIWGKIYQKSMQAYAQLLDCSCQLFAQSMEKHAEDPESNITELPHYTYASGLAYKATFLSASIQLTHDMRENGLIDVVNVIQVHDRTLKEKSNPPQGIFFEEGTIFYMDPFDARNVMQRVLKVMPLTYQVIDHDDESMAVTRKDDLPYFRMLSTFIDQTHDFYSPSVLNIFHHRAMFKAAYENRVLSQSYTDNAAVQMMLETGLEAVGYFYADNNVVEAVNNLGFLDTEAGQQVFQFAKDSYRDPKKPRQSGIGMN